MDFILVITAIFLVIRFGIVSLNLFDQPFMETTADLTDHPKVAVLIPARNEAHNLPYLLTDLQQSSYPNLEIHVLDDASEDNTPNVIAEYQGVLPDLHLMQSEPIPAGWLGKNWACYQLANRTDADYMLFADADIRLSPDAISSALVMLKQKQVKLYTLFPRQHVKTIGEKLLVPLVYYTLATLLPIRWVENRANPAFSAANGQFMLMEGANYQQYQWHLQLKDHPVEDMGIMQEMKKQGFKVAAELTLEHMSCRMYQGLQDGLEGFSKNFKAFFANSWTFLGAFLCFAIVAPLILVFIYPLAGGLILLAEVLLVRPLAGQLLGFCLREMVLLAIPQMLMTIYLSLVSMKQSIFKQNQWKGRQLP